MNQYILIVLTLIYASFIGGLIGYERAKGRHIAGLRTHVLVCMTAATLMLVASDKFGLDAVSRIGQAIMTGVGFLGAGTIISQGQKVRGLTTAASIWGVAGLGLVIGLGAFFEATVATVIFFFILQSAVYRKAGTRP